MGIQKKGEKKQKAKPVTAANFFATLEGKDGNPNSPKEFDESHHGIDEVYFKADDEATEAEKNKILVLNFIHQALHYDTERSIPVLTKETSKDIEIYHSAQYQGAQLDVCVYWPPRAEGDFKPCVAMVKFTSDDLSAQSEDAGNVVIAVDASWNKPAKKDKFTKKVDALSKNYWAPRWKYVVKSLRDTMANDFEKNGVEIIHPEPEAGGSDNVGGADDNGEEIEEEMMVFSGATGKIIGPKGSKIQEIKGASKVKDIKMPAKNEDAPRPRARELVAITVIGTKTAIEKAKTLIKEVVDEWANAPRPPRDGGYGGGGDAGYQAPATDYVPPDTTSGGDWDVAASGGGAAVGDGATSSWADDAIAAAPAADSGERAAGGSGEQW